jgi:hypothetical protein
MKKIRYQDLDSPDGLCVAYGNGVRLWDENTAAELALTGMLLSQGAKRAHAMLDAASADRSSGQIDNEPVKATTGIEPV